MLGVDHPLPSTRLVMRDFLDEVECVETARRVKQLEDHWTQRSNLRFVTFGAASYLDAMESREAYLAAAAQTNPLLSKTFDDLYRGLLGFFEQELNEPVGYDEALALPGFHIFEFCGESLESFQDNGIDDLAEHSADKRAHFDLQFLRVIPDCEPDATLSFTVPLEQPSGGAGLAVWPLDCEEFVRRNLSAADLPRFAAETPYERVSYESGRMLLHDGLLLHAALGGGSAPIGRRITLQGHGVRCSGRWTLYW
jgi:hypothetical protein